MSLLLASLVTVGLHIGSAHIPQHDQNNQNPGAYLRVDSWQAGFYLNSHDRWTIYGGYALPLGPIDLMLGLASGYDERCTQTVTYTPAKVVVQQLPDGGTSKSTTPARTTTSESCKGFSKHPITPLFALSYAAPFTIFEARPRAWLMPGFGKVSTVIHASLEWSF